MWRLCLLALLLALPANAQTDNDTVRSASKPRFQVVDGDTVRFGSQIVRLFGIRHQRKGRPVMTVGGTQVRLPRKRLRSSSPGAP